MKPARDKSCLQWIRIHNNLSRFLVHNMHQRDIASRARQHGIRSLPAVLDPKFLLPQAAAVRVRDSHFHKQGAAYYLCPYGNYLYIRPENAELPAEKRRSKRPEVAEEISVIHRRCCSRSSFLGAG
jgi:hypothetical protein